MRTPFFLALLVCSASIAMAQDQLAVRLNEKGLMKVLEMAVKFNSGSNRPVITIPKDLYKFTLTRQQMHANPIIPILNDLTNLNLNGDLDFYLETSPIQITGNPDPRSLKTVISNSKPTGFDVKLTLAFPEISVTGNSLSLCESGVKRTKKCGAGLKATINSVIIKTRTRPATVTANLRFSFNDGVVKVRFLSADSNLDSSTGPVLDINIKESNIVIPEVAVVINGQEVLVDQSKLKAEVFKKKTFLSKKLMSFAADFIASDLAKMLNAYFAQAEVQTSVSLYRRDVGEESRELSFSNPYAQDATYVHPPIFIRGKTVEESPEQDIMKVIFDQMAQIIRQAQVDLSLTSVKTFGNKDIQLNGALNLVLNHGRFEVRNTLQNSNRILPVLNLDAHRAHDISMAISEPLLNGSLDLISSTGLFQEIEEEVIKYPGLYIDGLRLHFSNRNTIMAVGRIAIDLKQLRSSILSSPREWIENTAAKWLERNNNDGVIYFPVEFEIRLIIQPNAAGGVALKVKVDSPFSVENLVNTYKYPTNVTVMNDNVREGVMKKVKLNLDKFTGKEYPIDLSKFLNQAGVTFVPKSISFDQMAYMIINLDIADIDFGTLGKKNQ